MAGFQALDKRLSTDEQALHDVLWGGSKADVAKLRSNIQRDLRALDIFLGAGGKLRRMGAALDSAWGGPAEGESLFELLGHTYNLTAATDHLVRRKDPKGAGEHVAEAVESVSIGVCSNAGCFEYVQEWEGGKTDFETYAGKLADHLQTKGVFRAGEFKRQLVAARTFGKDFDATASKAGQVFGARAAIANGLWVTFSSTTIRAAIGSPPKFSLDDFAAVLECVARRV